MTFIYIFNMDLNYMTWQLKKNCVLPGFQYHLYTNLFLLKCCQALQLVVHYGCHDCSSYLFMDCLVGLTHDTFIVNAHIGV